MTTVTDTPAQPRRARAGNSTRRFGDGPIAGEAEVMAELRRRCRPRGGAKRIAIDAGVSKTMISRVLRGAARINARIAGAIGFDLRIEYRPLPGAEPDR